MKNENFSSFSFFHFCWKLKTILQTHFSKFIYPFCCKNENEDFSISFFKFSKKWKWNSDEMTTMYSAGSRSAMFSAEASITWSAHFHLQVIVDRATTLKKQWKLYSRNNFNFIFVSKLNNELKRKISILFWFLFLQNGKMNSLNFNFQQKWKMKMN